MTGSAKIFRECTSQDVKGSLPQDKGTRDAEVKSARHFSLLISNANIRWKHSHLVVNRVAGQLAKCSVEEYRVIKGVPLWMKLATFDEIASIQSTSINMI